MTALLLLYCCFTAALLLLYLSAQLDFASLLLFTASQLL
jgi:hypothetical protein